MSSSFVTHGRPLLFLDIDDVVCLNRIYSGYDVIRAVSGDHPHPDDVYRGVFDPSACAVLKEVHEAMNGDLRYVISSTWREAFTLEQLRDVFGRTGLEFVADALHEAWCTPIQSERGERAEDIRIWMNAFHRGEPFAILDDTYSGVSLKPALVPEAGHPFRGRVVLCEEAVGLLPEHKETLLNALQRPMEAEARRATTFLPMNFEMCLAQVG